MAAACRPAAATSPRARTCLPRNARPVTARSGEGGLGDPLIGGQGTLSSAKPKRTVGSYWPYATTLFDYIRRAMPYNAPESLSADEVYAVSAFLLNQNGIVPADTRLDAASLPRVVMPNRDGFVPDPRPGRRL
jgi:hypothetical protein